MHYLFKLFFLINDVIAFKEHGSIKEVTFLKTIQDPEVAANKTSIVEMQVSLEKTYKSDHVILDPESYERDLKDFSFTFIELPKFSKKTVGW